MRSKWFFSIFYFVFGILLAVGPYTVFPVCLDKMMPMRCQNTAKAEIFLGILTIVIGVLLLFVKHKKLRILLNTLIIPVGSLAFLFPNVITGVCSKTHMTCRSLALPALSIISIILIVLAAVYTLYLWRWVSKGEDLDGKGIDFK